MKAHPKGLQERVELNPRFHDQMEQLASYGGKVCAGGEMYQNGSH